MNELLKKLREVWGIHFVDEKVLQTAFTHSSYANEERLPKTATNERLEFLGDAALELLISEYLYKRYPEKQEGELSKLRAQIVRTESLAEFSRRCEFDKYLLLGKGEEKMGGRVRDTNLENLFEAFLGALVIDQGIETVQHFVNLVMLPPIESGNYVRVTDYKTALQETLQIHGDTDIEYRVLDEWGPSHDHEFMVAVYENDIELGRGRGRSRKAAEQKAAEVAMHSKIVTARTKEITDVSDEA